MEIVNLDPKVLQFRYDRHLPRPKAVPFNEVNKGKIAYAGTADNLLMVIFRKQDKNEQWKIIREIAWFREVPKTLIDSIVNGNEDACNEFVSDALDGQYDCYIEENTTSYFL